MAYEPLWGLHDSLLLSLHFIMFSRTHSLDLSCGFLPDSLLWVLPGQDSHSNMCVCLSACLQAQLYVCMYVCAWRSSATFPYHPLVGSTRDKNSPYRTPRGSLRLRPSCLTFYCWFTVLFTEKTVEHPGIVQWDRSRGWVRGEEWTVVRI